MNLLFSLIQISFSVELWRQARIPDTGAADIDLLARSTAVSTRSTVLRADRWIDTAAGELRSPAVVVVEGNLIKCGQPR